MCVPVLSLGVATLTLEISLITITNETRRQYNPQIPMFKSFVKFSGVDFMSVLRYG